MRNAAPGRGALLNLAVFVSGLSVMAVEMCASRLLAPYFGSSFEVWTLLLTVVLLTLCAGYELGGRLADGTTGTAPFYALLAGGGALVLVAPALGPSCLAWMVTSARMETTWGSLAASLVFVSPPLFLLAMVAPWAVRLRTESADEAPRAAGKLYALSTLGSIFGTFLPGLFLLPLLGTGRCFLLFGSLLLAVGAAGGLRSLGGRQSAPKAG